MFNYIPLHQWFGDSFSCHNLNFVNPISMIFLKLRKLPFKWCHKNSYLSDTYNIVTVHLYIQAVVFMEPGSSSFKAPLNYSIPSLSTGTQLCTEKPACCLRGDSFDHFYTNMQCPKIVMNITVRATSPHHHPHLITTPPHTRTHTHTGGGPLLHH